MNAMNEQGFNHPDPTDAGSRIDPVLARSWLLVNGAQYERFSAAVHSRADIVVLDIEDAVAPTDKVSARENVIRWLSEGNTDYARSRFTIAAKAAHLPSAIDGPTVGSSALKLSEATAVSAEFGMTGKICLTPDQCSAVNEGLSPSHDEISWANEFFAEYERDGGEIRNGSDLPRIARGPRS
jgi:citrate lyase beta subunit